MKKTKFAFIGAVSLVVLLGILKEKETGTVSHFLKISNQSTIKTPAKEVEALIKKQSLLPERDQKTQILTAFFNLKLDSIQDENQEGLNILEAAIRSGQRDAAPLIKDLLVDLAHNQIQIDDEYKNQVNRLILIMEKEMPYEIEAIKKANPDSITLKYLETIRG